MIKVLIAENSPVLQVILNHIFSSEPEIHVIGIVNNGAEALQFIERKKPDIITIDIHLPKMNGFEATRRIMEKYPVPVIILTSSYELQDANITFLALEAGAVAVVEKPEGIGFPGFDDMAKRLIQTIKLMSEVKVVKRRAKLLRVEAAATSPELKFKQIPTAVKCVAIGASTGGPPALQTILTGLSKDFPVPVLIVQHIAAGFLQGLVEWLGQASALPVRIASKGELLLPGHVYFAPDGLHMGVESSGRVVLCKEQPENSLRPSVSYLFRSVAKAFGPHAVGVLLTGMGSDGARELKLMKEKGAVTIVQDQESSVVYGMPAEAIKLGAAVYVLSPGRIPEALDRLVRGSK